MRTIQSVDIHNNTVLGDWKRKWCLNTDINSRSRSEFSSWQVRRWRLLIARRPWESLHFPCRSQRPWLLAAEHEDEGYEFSVSYIYKYMYMCVYCNLQMYKLVSLWLFRLDWQLAQTSLFLLVPLLSVSLITHSLWPDVCWSICILPAKRLSSWPCAAIVNFQKVRMRRILSLSQPTIPLSPVLFWQLPIMIQQVVLQMQHSNNQLQKTQHHVCFQVVSLCYFS